MIIHDSNTVEKPVAMVQNYIDSIDFTIINL